MQCELATFILCKNGQRIEDEVTDNEKNNSYQYIKSCRNKGYQSPERYLMNKIIISVTFEPVPSTAEVVTKKFFKCKISISFYTI